MRRQPTYPTHDRVQVLAVCLALLIAAPVLATMPEEPHVPLSPLAGGDARVTVKRVEVTLDASHIHQSNRTVRIVETYDTVAVAAVPLVLTGPGVSSATLDREPVDTTANQITFTLPTGSHQLRVVRHLTGWVVNARAIGDAYLRSACDFDTANLQRWGAVDQFDLRVLFPPTWWSSPSADEHGQWRARFSAPLRAEVIALRTEPGFSYALLLAMRAAVWVLFVGLIVLAGRSLRARATGRVRVAVAFGCAVAAPICLLFERVAIGILLFDGPNTAQFGVWSIPVLVLLMVVVSLASAGLWVVVTRPVHVHGANAAGRAWNG